MDIMLFALRPRFHVGFGHSGSPVSRLLQVLSGLPSLDRCGVQKELSLVMDSLPVSLTTSATDKLGKRDLLIYLAQLRELNKGNQVLQPRE